MFFPANYKKSLFVWRYVEGFPPRPPFLKSGVLSSAFFTRRCRILAFFWGVFRSILGVLLKTRFPYCRCRRRTLIFLVGTGVGAEIFVVSVPFFMVNHFNKPAPTPLTLQL